ncbi:hypothetical protein COCVIDRAFT_116875 [Bipolaris victoriae FI3]|uniref:Uncharacterized protein n=1 Tax=Bipolaris victoriae (strain FI3) TaxID=930091 RepID=W7E339_BIPV3|nr:hypothetical protein COCVIDRAFT_116875 [Bipolaris victoriae FI3]
MVLLGLHIIIEVIIIVKVIPRPVRSTSNFIEILLQQPLGPSKWQAEAKGRATYRHTP